MNTFLLQTYTDVGIRGDDNSMLLLIIMIISFLVGIFITRAVFSISKFLGYQKSTVLLLMKIARAQGVNEDEIFTAINKDHSLKYSDGHGNEESKKLQEMLDNIKVK